MAREVVAMDVRLRIAVSSPGINVAAFCRSYGISRETFYYWKHRYATEGLAGLEARSRAPLTSPHRTGEDIEDAIVSIRKELVDRGTDHGPATIQWHLGTRGLRPVPSETTIWRILKRRGFISPEPRKRPTSSWRRFEASAPNELWQADCTDWTIATGVVKILSFLDDHSRVALRVRALDHATSVATWDTFSQACTIWGTPLGQLTDNGLNFSGKLRGVEVYFEHQLRTVGVVPKTSRPYHPQTCGKVERFQQTLKKWLRRRRLAADLTELQTHIDEFVDYYNHHRPHRGIGRTTPAQRWAATPPAINLGIALPRPARRSTPTVAPNGIIEIGGARLNLGTTWAGHTVTVHQDEHHLAVFHDHQLIRALTLEPGRTYYNAPN
jgi:transposase InsO family protein